MYVCGRLYNCLLLWVCFFFSSRRRHTRCALVTGVQTCALPILAAIAARLTKAEATIAAQAVRLGQQEFVLKLVITELDRVDPGNAVAKQIGRASCRERVCQYV